MLGAIVGDIVGSVYEWDNIKTKDFPLFREDCFFTDDTVMTCAVAEAIMNGGQKDDFIDAMKKYGRMYPDAGYGQDLGIGLMATIENLIIALEMAQQCVYLLVLGSWIVASLHEQVLGHLLEILREFLQR